MDLTEFKTLFHTAFIADLADIDFKRILDVVHEGVSMSVPEAVGAMRYLMSGEASEEEIALFLTDLHHKGETVEEIAASACTMREVALTQTGSTIAAVTGYTDTCGTGGKVTEGLTLETFNVSTAAMFVLAACGVKVAKHGNRSLTSRCGSADVLERLGIMIDGNIHQVITSIEAVGFGFLFAPQYHASTRYVQPVRKQLAHTTVFNILGPLSNPLHPSYQVIGVYDPDLTEMLAQVLHLLGVERAMVVHGYGPGGGMDELSTVGKSKVSELLLSGEVKTYYITPAEVGLTAAEPACLRGGDINENVAILKAVLSGTADQPKQDLVALNAAAGLLVSGVVPSFSEGVKRAHEVLKQGGALQVMEKAINLKMKR